MSETNATAKQLELLSSDDVSRTVARIAHQIIEKTALDSADAPRVILLGIPSGGVPLAQRLAHKIEEFSGVAVPWGSLDITLYRDDLRDKPHRALRPTNIPVDIDGAIVVLVDDVLATGGTLHGAKLLLESAGAEVAGNVVVLEVKGLNGRERLSGPPLIVLNATD